MVELQRYCEELTSPNQTLTNADSISEYIQSGKIEKNGSANMMVDVDPQNLLMPAKVGLTFKDHATPCDTTSNVDVLRMCAFKCMCV